MRPPNGSGEPTNSFDPWLAQMRQVDVPLFPIFPWERERYDHGKTFLLSSLLRSMAEHRATSGVRIVVDVRGGKEEPVRFPAPMHSLHYPVRLADLPAHARLSELATTTARCDLHEPETIKRRSAFSLIDQHPRALVGPEGVGKSPLLTLWKRRYTPVKRKHLRTRDGREV